MKRLYSGFGAAIKTKQKKFNKYSETSLFPKKTHDEVQKIFW